MIEYIFLVEQNLDLDRQGIEMTLHLVAQTFDLLQTGLILLCGDDELGRGEGTKGRVDPLDILLLEIMMVAEGQRRHLLGIGLQIVQHLLGRGDACQQQDVLIGQG